VATSSPSGVRGVRLQVFDVARRLSRFSIALVLIVMWIAAGLTIPRFGTPANLVNIVVQSADLIIAAIGVTFVLMVGGIDLGIGSVFGLASVVVASVLVGGGGLLPAVAAALAAGALIGLLNGIVIERLRIPSFIVTLGTAYVALAIAQIFSHGASLYLPTETRAGLAAIASGSVLGAPTILWLPALVAVTAWLILNRTAFGRAVVAVGYNRGASELSGIRASSVVMKAFVISGLLAALGGTVLTARIAAGIPNLGGFVLLFEVITAAVVGGTSLFGGKGTIFGTIVGALIIRTIGNAIVLLNVTPLLYQAIMGLLILLALIVERVRAVYFGDAS
jgi:ribose transport system permease protein